MEWKGKIINNIDEKIKSLSSKTSLKFCKSILQQNNPLKTLNNIHNQFVVASIDTVFPLISAGSEISTAL